MKTKPILICMMALAALGCNSGGDRDESKPAAGAAATPTKEHAANAIYEDIYDYALKLDDGLYEGEPFVEGASSKPRVELIERVMAFGDLNADGVDDAAVLLVESSGGSGSHLYLAAVFVDGLNIRTSTTLIGDRTQVRSLSIEDRIP